MGARDAFPIPVILLSMVTSRSDIPVENTKWMQVSPDCPSVPHEPHIRPMRDGLVYETNRNWLLQHEACIENLSSATQERVTHSGSGALPTKLKTCTKRIWLGVQVSIVQVKSSS